MHKRIFSTLLITGGCGFIGTNFIKMLILNKFEGNIINLDKLTYAGIENKRELDHIVSFNDLGKNKYKFVKCDITNYKKLKRVFEHNHIDGIVHFAAESHVDRSIKSSDKFIQSNIIGTHNLLDIIREVGYVQLFHHVSTDEVFGSITEGLYADERYPYNPQNPYAATKASSDHLVRSYYNTYNLPVTISNCTNNYGPYQFPEKLIPMAVNKLQCGEKIPIYGDGTNKRDWLYVMDHCSAIEKILRYGMLGESYNISAGNDITNKELVDKICNVYGNLTISDGECGDRYKYVMDRPGHDLRYAMDSCKIRKELGWEPLQCLDKGLRMTINWYLHNPSWITNCLKRIK